VPGTNGVKISPNGRQAFEVPGTSRRRNLMGGRDLRRVESFRGLGCQRAAPRSRSPYAPVHMGVSNLLKRIIPSTSAETVTVTMSGPRPGSVGRFRSRVGTLSAPSARPATCGVSAPCGSGSGRLVEGAGTRARIGRTLTIAGRGYGKGEGGRPLSPSGRGHSVFRSVLMVARGREARPLWNPRPLRGAARRRAAPPALPCFHFGVWLSSGWRVLSAFTQPGPRSSVSRGTPGRRFVG
jgi:hypothetical protein